MGGQPKRPTFDHYRKFRPKQKNINIKCTGPNIPSSKTTKIHPSSSLSFRLPKNKKKALSSHQNLGFFFPFSKRGSMEVEQKQAQVIEHFVKQASSLQGSSLVSLIVKLTSHSSLFAFSEILAVPNVLELQGTGYAVYIDLLRLFAHGTWSDYKSNASHLPPLVPDQITKLKQLTVLSLAEMNRVISYDQLLEQLDLSNVRELEDFLINDCMYAGIVKGKLDHLRRSFEVQFAAGRDLRPGQLGNLIQTLDDWLDTTKNAILTIEEKIKWADKKCELDAIHKRAVKDRVEEVKKSVNNKGGRDFQAIDDILFGETAGLMDYEEDRTGTKRRRSPVS